MFIFNPFTWSRYDTYISLNHPNRPSYLCSLLLQPYPNSSITFIGRHLTYLSTFMLTTFPNSTKNYIQIDLLWTVFTSTAVAFRGTEFDFRPVQKWPFWQCCMTSPKQEFNFFCWHGKIYNSQNTLNKLNFYL